MVEAGGGAQRTVCSFAIYKARPMCALQDTKRSGNAEAKFFRNASRLSLIDQQEVCIRLQCKLNCGSLAVVETVKLREHMQLVLANINPGRDILGPPADRSRRTRVRQLAYDVLRYKNTAKDGVQDPVEFKFNKIIEWRSIRDDDHDGIRPSRLNLSPVATSSANSSGP